MQQALTRIEKERLKRRKNKDKRETKKEDEHR
jgi:hypothetical protein